MIPYLHITRFNTQSGRVLKEDNRPYWAKRLHLWFRHWYTEYFLRPECASLGPYHTVMKPWYVKISGPNIHIGHSLTAIGEPSHRVELGVWGRGPGEGKLIIGDAALLSPGVRISASDEIRIGDGVMMANGAYVTDCDWHTLYDRNARDPNPQPVRIGNNVWIGDHAIVLKGVTIGDNSVVGAGSVVTKSIPSNVVVAGNPAQIVKHLDPEKPMVTRQDHFKDPAGVIEFFDGIDRVVLKKNTTWRWILETVYPSVRHKK